MAIPLLALGGLQAGVGFLGGILQRNRARELEQANNRPIENVSNYLLRNQALVEQMASQGMASEAYNNALQQQQQALVTGLRTSGTRGNTATNVNNLVRNAQQGINQLNATDSQIRNQNKRLLLNQNQTMAREEARLFNQNFLQPWQYTAQRAESLRRAGNNNIIGALGAFGQYAMANATMGNQASSLGTTYNPDMPFVATNPYRFNRSLFGGIGGFQ